MDPPNSLDPNDPNSSQLSTSFNRLLLSALGVVGSAHPHPAKPNVQFPEELIIHHSNTARSLNNRWAFSAQVIDYKSVCNWKKPLEFYDLVQLKRVKICGLPASEMVDLLTNVLPDTLEQMDIDAFRLFPGKSRFVFDSLRILSIEARSKWLSKAVLKRRSQMERRPSN